MLDTAEKKNMLQQWHGPVKIHIGTTGGVSAVTKGLFALSHCPSPTLEVSRFSNLLSS